MSATLSRCRSIEVTHFQRHPAPDQHSLEMLAVDLRNAMPRDINIDVKINRFQRGILRRLWNMLAAWWQSGEINHVLGDTHYLAIALPSKSTIVTVMDCRSLERLNGLRRWVYWFLWFHLPLRRAAVITVISEFTKKTLLESVDLDPNRVQVIPVAISPAFKRAPRRANHERFRLLQVGTGSNKNLERVIEAVAGLNVELTVIGRLTRGQRRALAVHGVFYRNSFNLSRDEVVHEYRIADAVAFVSTYEGFGMPIVEAQATGRPVITSDRSPMRETSGGAALLVDPESTREIRCAIQRLLHDVELMDQLVRLGYKNANRFRPEAVAEAYATVYRRLTANASGQIFEEQ